jgi:S1-C subfamily serine protease
VAKTPAPTPPPATAPPKPAPLTPQQLVAKAGPSVAVLQGRRGSGSGFLVAPGLLATNRHVVEDELVEQVRVQWPDAGRAYEGAYGVTLVYEDPAIDLAFLEVDVKLPPLPLALDAVPARGQEIMCIGSPGVGGGQMLSNAIGRGLLGTPAVFEGQEYLQLDLAVNPGNSGGPVFNMDGKVVGVVTLKAAHLSGVGFCLPVRSLGTCLERAKALSTSERARVVALHRLRVCAKGLLRAAKVYASAGDLYVAAMNASKAAKENINVGLRKAQAAVDDYLHQMNGEIMFTVREHAERAARDEALAASSRDRYKELLDLHGKLRDHVQRPSGTLDGYIEAQKTYAKELRSLEAHFVRNEGVRPDDD